MSEVCSYGCGKIGKYQLKNKKWCCSESFNSCPEKRFRKLIKTTKEYSELCENGCGLKSTHQTKSGKWICNKDHRKCPINKLKYGHDKCMGKKHSEETKIKIGLKSKEKKGKFKPEVIELYRKRMTGSRNPRYGKSFKHKEESKIKLRKTMEELGYWNKLEELSEFERYKREVYTFTNISVKEKYSNDELKNRGRLKEKHIHIDHIFSIIKAFKLKIDPRIIGSKSNIRIITVTENCSKQSKCDISLDELYKKYEVERLGKK